MNRIILFFISSIFSILAFANGGVGGSGGGTQISAKNSRFVTVEVCDGGETGLDCRMVTYKLRPANPKTEPVCTIIVGEQQEVPCNKNAKVPEWLKKFNQYLEQR